MNTVEINNVSKKYFLRKEAARTLKATALSMLRGKTVRNDFWALKDLNLHVEAGETIGIIGATGAGKSTLLGIRAGTITPTTGEVKANGRISSLLELGAGFHPDLTGRENIYLNGSILGLSRKYIDNKFDDIVAFAGLSDFIDSPVKHYSSGMYVRLGFAVAVEVDPEILLIDEVLAVGDESFKKKCLGKIAEFQQQGKTIIVVSHDLDTVKKICRKVMLLGEGKMLEIGEADKVVEEYKRLGLQQQDDVNEREWGTKDAVIANAIIMNERGEITERFNSGDNIRVRVEYSANNRIEDPVFGFAVSDYQGRLCCGSNTIHDNLKIDSIQGEGALELNLSTVGLMRGKFYLSLSLHSRDHQTNYHRLDNKFNFWVLHDNPAEGFVNIPSKWEIK